MQFVSFVRHHPQAAQMSHAEHVRDSEAAAIQAAEALGAAHMRLCDSLEQQAARLSEFAEHQEAEADAAAAAILQAIDAGGR